MTSAQRKKKLLSILVKPSGPDCNMACSYCFYQRKSALFPDTKIHRMSEEILEEMTSQCMAQAESQISFGWQGGEPTLMGLPFYRKAVELQQKYGKNLTVGNGLQTNGLLIDEEWIDFLKEYSFLVGLSLDGPEHIHDKYRALKGGGGAWAKVSSKAELLLKSGISVNALAVINDYSARFPEQIYRYLKDIGLNFMQFIPVVEKANEDSAQLASFSTPAEEFGGFLCTVFDLWLSDFKDGAPTTSVRFFDAVFHTYAGLKAPECTLLDECGVYVVVEHNGDVYSCDFFVDEEHRLGNIRDSGLKAMLNSKAQQKFGQIKSDIPDVCKVCPWLIYCRGGCPKDRVITKGDQRLNHLCDSYRIFFEHAHKKLQTLADEWKKQQAPQLRPQADSTGKKPGRNDPCSCGSGRKFKKCCQKKSTI